MINMEKKCKVIMLPAENGSVWRIGNSDFYSHKQIDDRYTRWGHLYILSDEEIKEGDCFLGYKAGEIPEDGYWVVITPLNKKEFTGSGTFVKVIKIIATTNPELHYKLDNFDNHPSHSVDRDFNVPNIPQDFIELFIKEYNAGNPIKEVMVKYISGHGWEPTKNGPALDVINEVKINSDSTICISKVEEKKYSREELKSACLKAGSYAMNTEDHTITPFEEWFNKSYPE